jgi:hypothetical protein
VNRTEIADGGAAAVCAFLQVELAKEHRTGSLQAANNVSVLGWNTVFEYGAGGGGVYASGTYQIFEGNRDSM